MQETDREVAEAIRRGERARSILEDEVFLEIVEGIEEDHIEAWRTSDVSDHAGREIAFLALRQLDVLKARLGALVASAEIERARVDKRRLAAS